MTKGLSVGFVIVCPNGVLIGHTTGANHWDVPKGGLDEGEAPLDGAKRELFEETGLSWDGTDLVCKFSNARYSIVKFRDLGQHEYTKRKDLHMFELVLSSNIDTASLKCESMVERPNYSFPELDRFTIASGGLSKLLTPALFTWLKAHM